MEYIEQSEEYNLNDTKYGHIFDIVIEAALNISTAVEKIDDFPSEFVDLMTKIHNACPRIGNKIKYLLSAFCDELKCTPSFGQDSVFF